MQFNNLIMPKFSIIVPVYNVEREYLEAALNSVLAQTFSDWECICVDDGSTNDAGDVLDEYAAKDHRIKVYHTSNHGVSAARNLALTKTSGDWLFFFDGDDLLTKDSLNAINNVIDKYPSATLIRYRFDKFNQDDVWPKDESSSAGDQSYAIDLSHSIPASCYETSILQFVVHKSITAGITFPPITLGEDRVFLYHCLRNCREIAGTKYKLYGYRQRASSATHADFNANRLKCGFFYAVESLKAFSGDNRKIEFYDIPSLVRHIAHDYVSMTVNKVRRCERQPLWKLWFDELSFLASDSHFHFVYRYIFKVCNATQSKMLSYLLCGVFLCIAWRIHLPFAKAMNPTYD